MIRKMRTVKTETHERGGYVWHDEWATFEGREKGSMIKPPRELALSQIGTWKPSAGELLDRLDLLLSSAEEEIATRFEKNPEDETAICLQLLAIGLALEIEWERRQAADRR